MPPNPCLFRRRYSGFSLVELLVVLAVIGLLLSLSIAAIQNVRESSKAARCGTNMRAVGAALSTYAMEHDGYFPAVRSSPDSADEVNGRQNELGTWEAEIEPYVGFNLRTTMGGYDGEDSDDIMQALIICEAGEFVGMSASLNNQKASVGGKKLNWGLDFQTNVNSIEDPTATLLLGDSDEYHLSFTKDMLADADGKYKGADLVRHGGKANYLFVDGHLESLTPEEIMKLKGWD